jgi:MFS family permease
MMFAGVNGLGLALLVPCCQSLIADLYPAEQRGRAFGTLQLTASLGGMLGGVFATNMGGLRPLGIDGWRAAFHCIALLSLIVGECQAAQEAAVGVLLYVSSNRGVK